MTIFTLEGTTTLNGVVETISGAFDWDPVTNQDNALITLSGPAPYAGNYSAFDFVFPSHPVVFATRNDGIVQPMLGIGLAFLGNGSPIESVSWEDITDAHPTGFATTGVPEPSSLALLAIFALLTIYKRIKQ
jgi:hypothetical protein